MSRFHSVLYNEVDRSLSNSSFRDTLITQANLASSGQVHYEDVTVCDLICQVHELRRCLAPYIAKHQHRNAAAAATAAAAAAAAEPTVIAVCLPTGAEYAVAVLAALAAGCAFAAIDPLAGPDAWLKSKLQQCAPAVVLWSSSGGGGSSGGGAGAGAGRGDSLPAFLQGPGVCCPALDIAAALSEQDGGAQAANGAGEPAALAQSSPLSSIEAPQAAAATTAASGAATTPLPWCCLLFTSGSSAGQPLAVRCTEQGLLNRCRWMQERYPLRSSADCEGNGPGGREGDVVAFRTSPSFVDHLWEVFGPLLAGVPLLALPPPLLRSPPALLRALAERRATRLALVPSLLRALLPQLRAFAAATGGGSDTAAAAAAPAGGGGGAPTAAAAAAAAAIHPLALRVLVSSGEPLPVALLREAVATLPPRCTVLNLYGSTEASADATFLDAAAWLSARGPAAAAAAAAASEMSAAAAAAADEMVPVGLPISGMSVLIAAADDDDGGGGDGGGGGSGGDGGGVGDGALRLAAPGQVGEVVLAGIGVAAGYHSQLPAASAAAAARFLLVPQSLLARAPQGTALRGEQRAPHGGAARGPGLAGTLPATTAAAPPPAAAAAAAAAAEPALNDLVPAFRTGDLGCVGRDGLLRLLGRRDHQVKVAGVRFNLLDVERALEEHPSVTAAAAVLVPAAAAPGSARIEAFVEAAAAAGTLQQQQSDPLQQQQQQQLREWCAARLPPQAVPSKVVAVPRLPRSAAGKLLRPQLLQWAAAAIRQHPVDSFGDLRVDGRGSNDDAAAAAPALRKPGEVPAAAAAAEAGRVAGAMQGAAGDGASSSGGSLEARVVRAFADNLPTGGTSLDGMRVCASLGIEFPLLLAHPTPRALARHLSGRPPPAEMPGQERTTRRRLDLPPPTLASGGSANGVAQPGTMGALDLTQGGVVVMHAAHIDVHGATPAAAPTSAASAPAPTAGATAVAAAAAVDGHALLQDPTAPAAPASAPKISGCRWRVKMGACIDAPPLIVAAATPAAATAIPPVQACDTAMAAGATWRAFACCHDGGVVCIDGASGRSVWRAQLPARCDAGMAVSDDMETLAVACGDGTLRMLCTETGAEVAACSTEGEVRSPPRADPRGLGFWTASHGGRLMLHSEQGDTLASMPTGGPCSAGAAVARSTCLAVFAATLRGDLVAFAILGATFASSGSATAFRPTAAAGSAAAAAAGGNGSTLLRCAESWRRALGGPVFSTPLVLLPTAGVAAARVVACTVGGALQCFGASDGTPLWRAELGAEVFAPLAGPLPFFSAPPGAAAAAASALTSPHQPYAHAILVAARDGSVAAVRCTDGGVAATARLGEPISAAPTASNLPPLATGSGGGRGNMSVTTEVKPAGNSGAWVAACTAEGSVMLMHAATLRVMDSAALPAGLFSSPVAWGGSALVVGCRDDFLYCLDVTNV